MVMTRTDRQWDKWSRENPYFGVLGVETKSLDDPEVKARFFGSGEADIAAALAATEAAVGPVSRGRALDFGCGVGRLLPPLAERFEEAVGVDIALPMLEIARANTSAYANVSFAQTPADVAATGKQFDFIHSYIVLQHIRPVQGTALIEQLVGLLRPGGAFALHFTVSDSRPRRRILNRIRYRIKPLHWAYNISVGRPWNESMTEMNHYDIGAIQRRLLPMAEDQMSIKHVDNGGHNGLILMGRKRK